MEDADRRYSHGVVVSVRAGHSSETPLCRFEPIGAGEIIRSALAPLESHHAALLEANIAQSQRPAETNIADAFVTTVVSASDSHRHARNRNIQISKLNGE